MNSAVPPEIDRSSREDGFTLIEVLVSLTLLGLILGLLGGGLRVLAKGWEANTQRIEALDMVSRAFDILQRDAAGLQRLANEAGGAPRYIFSGGPESLSFVALEPPYPSEAGPYFISYAIAANGADRDLIRSRAPYRQGMTVFPGATPANRVPLLEGPYRYRFEYARKGSGEPVWQSPWPDRDRLPDLIRLEITDADPRRSVVVPMVAAVRADAELTCIGEQVTLCSAASGGALLASPDDASRTPSGARRANE
jgi:general secretion pathway protein J